VVQRLHHAAHASHASHTAHAAHTAHGGGRGSRVGLLRDLGDDALGCDEKGGDTLASVRAVLTTFVGSMIPEEIMFTMVSVAASKPMLISSHS